MNEIRVKEGESLDSAPAKKPAKKAQPKRRK